MSTSTASSNSPAKIFYTDKGDGSADFTVAIDEENHKFSASAESQAVSYEETLSWRGQIQVAEPSESVYRALMTSDAMTDFCESYGIDHPSAIRQS